MITKKSDLTLEQSQEFTSYSFGIKESGLPHIFNVLRNQLYSDKVLAVIREYSCNAVDAHVEIGNGDEPIEITLPNPLSLEFKVRDYGRGLSENEIGEVYAMYGESTKRGTNEQIGQLGLGCKSAFAYGDNFIINSYFNGNKTSYNAFIDPSQIGRISKLSQEKSKEKSGIEIVIPVKKDDCEEFFQKAVDLFAYFKVKPNVKGVDLEDYNAKVGKGGILVEGEGWKVFRQGEAVAVMGNIAYPIDQYTLQVTKNGYGAEDDNESARSSLIDTSIQLDFDIGDLEISASREALQYTESTKKNILKKLDEIIKQIPTAVGKRFDECKTLWEAKSFYGETFKYGGVGYSLSDIVSKAGVVWNGIKLDDTDFSFQGFKEGEEVDVFHYNKPRYGRSKRIKGEKLKNIIANTEDTMVIQDDRSSHIGRLNRIAPLMEEYDGRDENLKIYKNVYLIKFASTTIKKKVLDKNKLDCKLVSLDSLPFVKLRDIYPSNSAGKSNPSMKSTKHTTKEFFLDQDSQSGRWENCRSNFFTEDAVDIENDEGIYLKIDKFYICGKKGNDETHPSNYLDRIKNLKNVGVKVPKVFCFKRGEEDTKWDLLDGSDNWTHFEDWATKEIKEILKKNNLGQRYVDRITALHHIDVEEYADMLNMGGSNAAKEAGEHIRLNVMENLVSKDSLFGEYHSAYFKMLNHKDKEKVDSLERVVSSMSIDSNMLPKKDSVNRIYKSALCDDAPSFDLIDLLKKTLKRYPLLSYLDDYYFGYRWKKSIAKDFINYINIIDCTFHTENIFEEVDKAKKKAQNIVDRTYETLTKNKELVKI
jgi:hypothetical protein